MWQYQSRLRDFWNLKYGLGFWPVRHIQAGLIADGANATLITNGHCCLKSGDSGGVSTYPRILPDARTLGTGGRTPIEIWRKYFNNTSGFQEMPELGLREKLPYSFTYCSAVQKRKGDSIWNFWFLTESFDKWTWLSIALSFILVSLLAHSSLRWRRLSFSFLSGFSVLSPGSVSGNVVKYRSKLFVLWILVSLVLINFYTGRMTSSVIKPPREEVLRTFGDLEKNNFTLIFDQKLAHGFLANTARILTQKLFVPRYIRALSKLLQTSVVKVDRAWFIKTMATHDKVASTNGWTYALWDAMESTTWISRQSVKSRKCHVGEELVDSGERYFALLPPRSIKLSKVYQQLLVSGIMQRWEQEDNAMAMPKRIQNHNQVGISDKLALFNVDNNKTHQLRMEGEIVTIFFLWAICIVGSSVWFFVEKSCRSSQMSSYFNVTKSFNQYEC